MSCKIRMSLLWTIVLVAVLASIVVAQIPGKGPIARFTASTENVGSPGEAVKIDIFAWSTDAVRDELVKAWTTVPAPPAAPAPPEATGAAGRGAAGAAGTADDICE